MSLVQKQFNAMSGINDRLDSLDPPAIPEGYKFNPRELRLWAVFTKVRLKKDWSGLDLVIVAKAVQLETRVQELVMQLDLEGPVLENRRGTPVANPVDAVLRATQNQQIALLKSIGALSPSITGVEKQKQKRAAKDAEHTEHALTPHDAELLPRH